MTCDSAGYDTDQLEVSAGIIVGQVMGAAPVRVVPIRRGVMTIKYAVELSAGQRLVVRFYPPSRAHVINYEPDVLGRCARAGVPVPDVISDSRSGIRSPLPFLVYRMIDGVPLAERLISLDQHGLATIAGDITAQLMAIGRLPMTGYGDLLTAERARFGTWQEFVWTTIQEAVRIGQRQRLFGEGALTPLTTILERVERCLPATAPSLTWGDVSPENILVDRDDRLAGLIDFEGALSADPTLNLGFCYARYVGTPFFDAILRAWPHPLQADDWQRVYLYAAVRGLRIVPYASGPLPTGLPRSALEEVLPGFRTALAALNATDDAEGGRK